MARLGGYGTVGWSKSGRDRGATVTIINGQAVAEALQEIEAGLKSTANRELRAASKGIADRILIPALKRSAAGSPMRMAKAFADTARAKSDRIVTVQIGGRTPDLKGIRRGIGATKVGDRKSRTGRSATTANTVAGLAWGSEYGPFPGAEVNTYGQPRREPAGYWVTSGVTHAMPDAKKAYERALEDIFRKYGANR